MGVSITLSGPKSWTRPLRTLNGVPASATSSPIRKTLGSRRISCASASRTASAMLSRRSSTAGSGIDMHPHLFRARVRSVEGELHALRNLLEKLFFAALQRNGVRFGLGNHGPGQDLQRVAIGCP